MTIIEKTDNKLTIPVGIGVVQTETTRNFYNTSDATATANDILVDKVAYGKYGKLTGTLDLIAEKEISYQDGYETGKTDGYENGYDIGYGNGYTEGETNGYNNGYNIGVADGVVEGKNEIIEGQSDATITPQNVLSGYVGYGKDNERIVGESDAITNIDVSANGIVFHNWTMDTLPHYYSFSNVTNLDNMFNNCPNFQIMQGVIDAISVENFGNIFVNCPKISNIAIYNISKPINIAPYNLLTADSVHYILDGLLPVEDSPIISLGDNIKKVTDEDLAAAANKGWLITGYNLIATFNVNLNDQWELSTTIPNPNSEEYDGVYQSFSNYHVANGKAQMMIEIEGYVNFSFFIRSYAESNYDYIWVGQLDKVPTSDNDAYATTKSKANGNTTIKGYTEVKFKNMDAGKHTIYVVYKKDTSGDNDDDRGYVLIPKIQ